MKIERFLGQIKTESMVFGILCEMIESVVTAIVSGEDLVHVIGERAKTDNQRAWDSVEAAHVREASSFCARNADPGAFESKRGEDRKESMAESLMSSRSAEKSWNP